MPTEPLATAADLALRDAQIAALAARVAKLETAPVPVPPPVVPPVPPVPSVTRKLLGGWRLAEEFARGTIAIDFAASKLYLAGHAQRREILVYDLPAMGTGADINAYPRLDPVARIEQFWNGPTEGDAYGLCWWHGKLWCSPRYWYAQGPDAGAPLTLYAADGETLKTTLLRQAFSGFVKRGPGLDPFLGGGGYDSGQGTRSGPSLARLDGKPLIEYQWPSDPADWNGRAPREPNYSVKEDSWVGWNPRNGEGRWACDRVYGGGLVLPEGITYWALLGTGDLDYARQNATFAASGMDRTYVYRYDATTFALKGWESAPSLGQIVGQEIDAQGRVYLCEADVWASGMYQVDPVVKVFG